MPVSLVDHPLAHDILAELRSTRTGPAAFRRAAHRMSLLLVAEATRDLDTSRVTVQTPLGAADGRRLRRDVVAIPVLRAGLGMLEAVLDLFPDARIGHIGLERDESTAVAATYYAKLPADLHQSVVLIVDPMLATGGSAIAAIDLARDAGATNVRLVCIVAAPEGVARVEAHDPEVTIVTPAIDRGLNAQKFIVPGLGDFGDRLYATL